jgi:hypothetical protein
MSVEPKPSPEVDAAWENELREELPNLIPGRHKPFRPTLSSLACARAPSRDQKGKIADSGVENSPAF